MVPPTKPSQIRAVEQCLPISKILNSREVLCTDEVCLELSTQLFAHYNRLRRILVEFSPIIRSRWQKKGKQQRTAILQSAWPCIPARRSDYLVRGKAPQNKSLLTIHSTDQEILLRPHLNLENLVEDQHLLLLFDSRVGKPPAQTFTYEVHNVCLFMAYLGLPFDGMKRHCMCLSGDSPETYGRLHSGDGADLAAKNRPFSVAAHVGLLIIECQRATIQFLTACCENMLHDIDLDEIVVGQDRLPPGHKLNWFREGSTTTKRSLSLHQKHSETPFKQPDLLDANAYSDLLRCRFDQAMDHWHSLRVDPGYFAAVISDWVEHCPEQVRDAMGNLGPELDSQGPSGQLWQIVVCRSVEHIFTESSAWFTLRLSFLKFVVTIAGGALGEEETAETRWKNVQEVHRTLQWCLVDLAGVAQDLLACAYPADPKLRSSFYRTDTQIHDQNTGESVPEFRTKCNVSDHLLDLLREISKASLPELEVSSHEIRRLLNTHPVQRRRVSSFILRILDDLFLISAIQSYLFTITPWTTFMSYDIFLGNVTEREYDQSSAVHFQRMALNTIFSGLDIAQADFLGRGRFDYPSHKKRSKDVVDRMRAAELNLDLFWARVEQKIEVEMGLPLKDIIVMPLRQGQRTSTWDEEQNRSTIRTAAHLPDAEQNLRELERRTQQLEVESVSKVKRGKQKTRGRNQNPSEPQTEQPVDLQPAVTLDPVAVGKRHYKTFSALFYDPESKDAPGEVAWMSFVAAMNAVGFASEKVYGSVWNFSAKGEKIEGNIQIHEPHPVAKLSLRDLRYIGRRLQRKFGWTSATFVRKRDEVVGIQSGLE